MAVVWLRKGARKGVPEGQSNLGLMYAAGRGVPQDDAKAVRLYRMAAEQGLPVAQVNLGNMYLKGRGVPRDDAAATAWFAKAAAQGEQRAEGNLTAVARGLELERWKEAIKSGLIAITATFGVLIAYRLWRERGKETRVAG
jgi:TPR repeat protein